MARITILGGTGYAGRNIAAIAARNGHQVTSWSRSLPEGRLDGVDYQSGDVADPQTLGRALGETDVVVSALSPRGDLEGAGRLRALEASIAELARERGLRFGVVGGAGSLLVSADGPKLAETDGFPDEFRAEAAEMDGVLQDLRAGDAELDWFFVSPAASFGPWAAGEETGSYRIGGDVLLADESGESQISGADFGRAVVGEIEQPRHRRARFTVAY
ncbi:NAD(P)-dependent oxidoreductase [Nocardioides daejeonensis]|uniref:NAD(P)-dependent oxidoreductase n=1 Tax=Nocardioides daejeonensis TaxID=1046556 RepID=UPI000D74AAEB|nr:NAD(P)H-binding protein [Nocardioides daejeonensis]